MEHTQDHSGAIPKSRLLAHLSVTRQLCEAALLKFEEESDDTGPLRTLETALNDMRHSLAFNHLTSLANLSKELKNIVNDVRSGASAYHTTITDIVLLTLEHIHTTTELTDENSTELANDGRTQQIISSLQMILYSDKEQLTNALRASLLVLDPSTQIEHIELQQPNSAQPGATAESGSIEQLFEHYGVQTTADLEFFHSLVEPIEARSQYWTGRSKRLLQLALKMNHYAQQPVDPTQLAAAVYMHDISMAFLPLEILHKKGRLNRNEKRILNGHARSSYEMLHRMVSWEEAAEMVLQHHEHMTGDGYPMGLTENEICDGAKIISIVDAFDARTHERAHTSLQRRPFVRAVLEINQEAGAQFSQHWVDIFNRIIRKPDHTPLHVINTPEK